jgi:site-specific DNA recombinase
MLENAAAATVLEQQRVLRLLVKDVLIGPERIVIRHSISTGGTTTTSAPKITETVHRRGPSPSSPLRWRSHQSGTDERGPARDGSPW